MHGRFLVTPADVNFFTSSGPPADRGLSSHSQRICHPTLCPVNEAAWNAYGSTRNLEMSDTMTVTYLHVKALFKCTLPLLVGCGGCIHCIAYGLSAPGVYLFFM